VERVARWQKAAEEGQRLADAFHETIATGSIRRRTEPLAE